jgi:hypothetical protein
MAGTLARRVLGAYGDVRGSYRAERALQPGEPRLLFYVMFACALVFAARLPGLLRAAPAAIRDGDGTLPAFLGSLLVAHVLFAPLLFYGLAAAARLLARRAGGRGDWREARLALFWALLLSVPLTVLADAAASLLGLGGAAALVLTSAPVLPFLWFWALCLAEAEGFQSVPLVAASLVAAPAMAVAALWLAGRG